MTYAMFITNHKAYRYPSRLCQEHLTDTKFPLSKAPRTWYTLSKQAT